MITLIKVFHNPTHTLRNIVSMNIEQVYLLISYRVSQRCMGAFRRWNTDTTGLTLSYFL